MKPIEREESPRRRERLKWKRYVFAALFVVVIVWLVAFVLGYGWAGGGRLS